MLSWDDYVVTAWVYPKWPTDKTLGGYDVASVTLGGSDVGSLTLAGSDVASASLATPVL